VDDEGNALPHDGETLGNLRIRGPWVCSEYYRDPQPDKFFEDWLNTGDIAKIDRGEYLIICDRTKDLIKSGGEWISSIDLENHILGIPGIRQAAVVAQAHPKWDERPVALVVKTQEASIDESSVIQHCATRFAKWQLPDEVLFVDRLPVNSTGKIDKKGIRDRLAATSYRLPDLR
jgi:fatty-acyl-CoA synthase